TDIFAFGAVMYEMVAGRRAFDGTSRANLIASIMERQPPPLSTVQSMSPKALDRSVETCLVKDADQRWQNAHDLKRELQWIEEGLHHLEPSRRSRKSANAHRGCLSLPCWEPLLSCRRCTSVGPSGKKNRRT